MGRIALVLLCAAMFCVFIVEAQVRNISGVVTSLDDGSVVSGVSVVVKGTTIGTITNIEGRYSLNIPEDAGTLVFSFVGMITQELSISGLTSGHCPALNCMQTNEGRKHEQADFHRRLHGNEGSGLLLQGDHWCQARDGQRIGPCA